MTATIPCTQGKSVIVDEADFEQLRQYKWCATLNSRRWPPGCYREKWYARTRIKGVQVYLHRMIWELEHGERIPPGMVVDHIDGDGLNNQRGNLRLLTTRENMEAQYVKYGLYQKPEEIEL